MDTLPFPRRRDWWLLGAGLLLLFVFALGSRGLNEPDEGRYANIGLAMAQPGASWWEPRMSGFAHYDKPPLIYWATAASLRAFGILDEWAARLPSLCGAGLALAGLGWAATRLYSARVAWWGVLICGTSVQFWVLGRVLSPDMLLTGWCTLAVGAWAECRHRGGDWRFWGQSLFFWSLGWWTKATPALVPLAGLAAGVWITGDAAGRKALRLWLLFPAILILGSPWYLSMLHLHPELKSFFFGRELAGRMAGRIDGRHGSKLYYLPVSLIAWLPWWPFGLWAALRGRTFPGPPPNPWYRRLGIEGWIVLIGLLIFSFAASKLPTYTLPLAPWAALLIARPLARVHGERSGGARRRWLLLLPAAGFALIALLTALILPRCETKLKVNSSLRDVCHFLQQNEYPPEVDFDHYWPGVEFYLHPGAAQRPYEVGSTPIRYVVNHEHQQERASDPGLHPELFVDPDAWRDLMFANVGAGHPPRDGRWLVRFTRQKGTVFESLFDAARASGQSKKIIRMGDFELLLLDDAALGH